jgi:LEA14-like dessication related protein
LNKLVLVGILIAIVTVGIVFGLIFYSYTQIHVSFSEVSSIGIELEQLSFSTLVQLGIDLLSGNWLAAALDVIAGINFGLIFELTNNGLLPVYIPEISYELSINEIMIGKGNSEVGLTLNPGQVKEIPILQNFKKENLSPAIDSIIKTEGVVNIGVRGTAYFELLGQKIPIPFESTKQVSIIDEIQSQLNQQN